MAQEWLPSGFENEDVTAPTRLAGGVRQRVQAHKRQVRTLSGGAAITALALILGAAPALWRSVRQTPEPVPQQIAQMKVEKPTWAPEAGAQKSEVGIRNSETKTLSPSGDGSHASLSPVGAIARSRQPQEDLRREEAAPTVTLAKAPTGIALAWTGNAQEEYVVYRCTSPKFDQCSVAGTVRGTQWNDTGSDNAPVVYYKVEPKA